MAEKEEVKIRMVKEAEEENREPAIFEDSIIVGLLHAKEHVITPYASPGKKVNFRVFGDVEKSLQEIYSNFPIGSLDVLRSIKLIRSMIFNFNLRGSR